jgi:hypothetical protein
MEDAKLTSLTTGTLFTESDTCVHTITVCAEHKRFAFIYNQSLVYDDE